MAFLTVAEPKIYADSVTILKTVIFLLGTTLNEVTITKYILIYNCMISEREMFIYRFSIVGQLKDH